jgi:signal transduction histidine kinase
VPSAERAIIAALATKSLASSQPVHTVIRGKVDLVALAAVRSSSRQSAIWAMKRLAGGANRGFGRTPLLGILIAAALISIGGTLATGIGLARGVTQIRDGLSSLEQNFDYRLPERQDELGTIGRSINKMADVRRKLEADLRREDRLRVAGRLAAGLAHEIRNPLNSIRLTVQLMQHRLKTGRLREEDLQIVQSEVDRLSALLNDLLDLQRERQSTPREQPLLPVLEHCLVLLERQAEMQGVRLSVAPVSQEISAAFDSQQLTQAVVNLLLNALEASTRGGEVKIAVAEGKENVSIEIYDNGPGLGSEQQEHLFEPFYTTKTAGTGLGLAVSRELMRSQGGDLFYRGNTPGASFSVRIPKELSGAVGNCIDS